MCWEQYKLWNYDYPHTIAFANLQWKLWKLKYSGSVLLPAERHGAPIWTKQRVANKKSSWQLWLNPPSSYPPPSCWFEYIQSKENVHERRVWASGTKLSWADIFLWKIFSWRNIPLRNAHLRNILLRKKTFCQEISHPKIFCREVFCQEILCQ